MNRSSIQKLGYKIVYTSLYRAHRIYCKIRNPEVFGSYVLCVHDKKVLLIKNSYKRYWTFPCGGIAAYETLCKLQFEKPKKKSASRFWLKIFSFVQHFYTKGEDQRDNIHLFEYRFETKPTVQIDQREVEAFCWVAKEDLSRYNVFGPILPYVHEALEP